MTAKEYAARYRKNHREELRERQRLYRKDHPEAIKATQKRRAAKHKDAIRDAQARYRSEHPDVVRGTKRKSQRRHWGIPSRPEPVGCEICNKPESRKTKDGRPHGLALDHDHATGQFRGWLCRQCNLAIGNMANNSTLLRKAAKYLEAFRIERKTT